MKNFLLLLAILPSLPLSSQVINLDDNTTRAVVIGISDYQDDKIPDLRFADRDALAFAEFLRSKSGGSLGEKQLKVLINGQATIGNMYDELDWLVAESKEGDRATIYFSGHGDIEVKTLNQEGFLLCYNSPPHNYRTNAFAVYYLKDIVAQLTQLKKAKVVLITDACRAGKLAGSETGGSQATTAALKEQFAGEVKILSCQPNEFSMEGEGWGGGRGAFSFHLLNGLYGKADRDKNFQVNLKEVWRYLDDRVPAETAPQTQNPMVVGDLETMLAEVRQDLLARVDSLQKAKPSTFSPGDMRGFEQVILAKADTGVQKTYETFLAALAAGRLMFPKDSSANDYFELLINEPGIAQMHGFLKRKFVAALINDAQEAMNGWLRTDMQELTSYGTKRHFDYEEYPVQLEKAAALLGEAHYLYNDLKAKEYFFRIRLLVTEVGGAMGKWDSTNLAKLFGFVQTGLQYDSLAPYLHFKKGYYYYYRGEHEKALECYKKAAALAPNWLYGYSAVTNEYLFIGKYRKAEEWAWRAARLDSTSILPYNDLYWIYQFDHQFEQLKKVASKTVEVMEAYEWFNRNLLAQGNYYWWGGQPEKAATSYKARVEEGWNVANRTPHPSTSPEFVFNELGWITLELGNLDEAEKWFQKSDSILENSNSKAGLFISAFKRGQNQLADEYFQKAVNLENTPQGAGSLSPFGIIWQATFLTGIYDRQDEAILILTKGKEHYPNHPDLHYHLARLHLEQKNDYETGVPLLEKAVQLDSTHAYAHYHLAAAYAHLGKKQAALDYLEKALEKGYEDFEQMEKDARWERLRGTKKYSDLMKKYVPTK